MSAATKKRYITNKVTIWVEIQRNQNYISGWKRVLRAHRRRHRCASSPVPGKQPAWSVRSGWRGLRRVDADKVPKSCLASSRSVCRREIDRWRRQGTNSISWKKCSFCSRWEEKSNIFSTKTTSSTSVNSENGRNSLRKTLWKWLAKQNVEKTMTKWLTMTCFRRGPRSCSQISSVV